MFVDGLTDKKSFLAAQKEQGVDEKTAKAKFKELTALEKNGVQQYGARVAIGFTETKLHELKYNTEKVEEPKKVTEPPKRRNLSPR